MRETQISVPELVLVAGTRAVLGAGLGLLLADRLSAEQRRAVGWTLFLVGALSTIPLALEVFGGHRLSASAEGKERGASGVRSEANEHLWDAFAET
jgi:uncharacterized membrane protein